MPRFVTNLPNEDILASGRRDRVPPEILAAPLLREDAKERRSEAENETEEPQGVDGGHARRCMELGRRRERFGGLVEERLHTRRRPAVAQHHERQELDRGLGVVGLEEDEGGDDERREHGGEETGLFAVSEINHLKE